MRRILLIAFSLSLILPILAMDAPRTEAQAGDAWSLIAEVNALRASYGLPPYEVNNALMAAAQAQSEWQAEIGTWSHSGPGGSRPHDRAVAFGYGGGAQVYISENVAMGVDLSPQQTVYEMWQDAIHLETMISSNYRHIGAGVAFSGDYVFYTIDVGYIAGSPGAGQPPAPPEGVTGTPAPTIMAMIPIEVATPKPDGSIIHVVQWGQFLINIAKAYKIQLKDLLAMNGLTENAVIFPGDKLLIKPGKTPSGTLDATGVGISEAGKSARALSTPSPAAKRLTATPVPASSTPQQVALSNQGGAAQLLVEQEQIPLARPSGSPDYLLIALLVMAAAGIALVLLGSALKRVA